MSAKRDSFFDVVLLPVTIGLLVGAAIQAMWSHASPHVDGMAAAIPGEVR